VQCIITTCFYFPLSLPCAWVTLLCHWGRLRRHQTRSAAERVTDHQSVLHNNTTGSTAHQCCQAFISFSLYKNRTSSIYAYTLWHRTTKFDVVTHTGRGACCYGVCHAATPRTPHQEDGAIALHNLEVLLCLCLHSLTQNDHIRHGNIYGGLSVSQPPVSRVQAPALLSFLGSLLFMRTLFDTERQNLTW